MPEWVQWGNAFEDEVQKFAQIAEFEGLKEVTEGSKHFNKIATACIGGKFQQVCKKELQIGEYNVVFYGKMDVEFDDRIYDIKTTINYKGEQKYKKGWQHRLYPYLTGKTFFKYLVAEWAGEDRKELVDTYEIPIEHSESDMRYIGAQLSQAVHDLVAYLHDNDLYQDYLFTFSNNRTR